MVFKNSQGKIVIDALISIIQENKAYLSDIDGKIGDGDHGINMNKGFSLCADKLTGVDCSLTQAFATLSQTLMKEIGGSMGPLYGVFFEGMATVSADKETIDASTFEAMLAEALEGVQDIGNAKRGDKTLLDTLIPAKEAFSESLSQGKDFTECLDAMKCAAQEGWQATESMVAKVGRASRLGERSRGVLDAGATSCYLLVSTLANSIQSLLA